MRRTAAVIALLISAVAFIGCSATSEPAAAPSPTPTPTVDPNIAACASFADVLSEALEVMGEGGSTRDDWDPLGARMDEIGLQAEGDVRERLLHLAENWPSFGDVMFGQTDTVEDAQRVQRACAA